MNPPLLAFCFLVSLKVGPIWGLIDVSYNILYLPMVVVRNKTCDFSRFLEVEGILRIDANRSCIDNIGHSYILNQNEGIVDLSDEIVKRNQL
ncbi:hypothetical protein L596_024447 [Steinernema carpocapsae]|uniref:Uncharacterized protein n=1 Tax=Steinernema carpocapsae TaxID=34508 RepID=A0A4U5MGR7_STECR|nr:hypothetical protein L596_024447 [Steinernema carpocapsae]